MHHEITWLLQKRLPSAFSLGPSPALSLGNRYCLVLFLLLGVSILISEKESLYLKKTECRTVSTGQFPKASVDTLLFSEYSC